METMRAVGIRSRTDPDEQVYVGLARPQSGDGDVLVRVHAAALTPTEFSWPGTWKTQTGADRPFPVIPGHEFSGVVAALGAHVSDLAIGDAVYGFNDWDQQGAQAEYCLARPQQLAPIPQTLDFAQAAEAPISALTAWQALFDHAHLEAGQNVLIHGATGGVGAFAVQLARWRGAHVIATASTPNVDYAHDLGASQVIDYTTARFDEAAHDMHVVLDTVGGATLTQSWGVLRPEGVLISIVTPISQEQVAAHNRRGVFFVVEPKREQLIEIGRLFDGGELHPLVAAIYPLDRAREAYARARAGHLRGKVVLQIIS